VHIQAEGRGEREREKWRKRGDDQREREGGRDERGRMDRGFGMPRHRETEENESSAIGAYYGSHVLFW